MVKGEKAFEAMADILDPIIEISQDKKVTEEYSKSLLHAVKYVCKKHASAVKTIVETLQDKDMSEATILDYVSELLDLFEDQSVQRMLTSLFPYAEQKKDSTSSGSAMETTEG